MYMQKINTHKYYLSMNLNFFPVMGMEGDNICERV